MKVLNDMVACYAGPIAQEAYEKTKAQGGLLMSLSDKLFGSEGDYAWIFKQARAVSLLKDHAGLEPFLKIAYWRAKLLMLRQWYQVSAVAVALLERGNLSEAQLRALMQQAPPKDCPIAAPRELRVRASLRSDGYLIRTTRNLSIWS